MPDKKVIGFESLSRRLEKNMFVLKHGEEYLRFGSYSTCTPVDKPEQATLYTRCADAERRLNGTNFGYFYHKREKITINEVEIYEVEFTSTEKKV